MIDKNDYTRDIREEKTPPPAPPPPAPPPKTRARSRAMLLLLAFLPGLGHMYLGLIRRGLFYLSAFAFAIFMTVQFSMLGFGPFILLGAFAIVGVVTVAFFETLVIRRELSLGKELEDQIPPFAKNRNTLIIVALLVVVPFVINLLTTLSWYAWGILGIIFVGALIVFSKKR